MARRQPKLFAWKTKAYQKGGSVATTIPKPIATGSDIEIGDVLTWTVTETEIVIRKDLKKRPAAKDEAEEDEE